MRFAEKMLLNATIYKLRPYGRVHPDGRCALGLVEEPSESGGIAEVQYPWLLGSVKRPCNCPLYPNDLWDIAGIIAHLFDAHVMDTSFIHQREPWTLEQLADWIDSVDPTPKMEDTNETPASADTLVPTLVA